MKTLIKTYHTRAVPFTVCLALAVSCLYAPTPAYYMAAALCMLGVAFLLLNGEGS